MRLTFGLERRDQHDRFLAFVWNGDVLLNEELIRAGLAEARLGYRYSNSMKRRFAAARKKRKGQGGGSGRRRKDCSMPMPQRYVCHCMRLPLRVAMEPGTVAVTSE